MDPISISAAAGMKARMESLELLANNLANVETGGYKADREFYNIYASIDASSDPETGQIQTIPSIENHWTDFAQGEIRATNNPLDLALDGDGLFAVQTKRGTRYTRDGNFRVLSNGVLAAADGSPVRAQGGGQIVLKPDLPVEILADGSVRQESQAVGQLDVVSFDRGALSKEGSNYFASLAGALSKRAPATVLQGKLERSNVGTAESAVRLVEIMRQFEMLQKAAGIGNEINSKAIQEVARPVS